MVEALRFAQALVVVVVSTPLKYGAGQDAEIQPSLGIQTFPKQHI